jgi:hypothetical protein
MDSVRTHDSADGRGGGRLHMAIPMPSPDLAQLLMRRLLTTLDREDYTFRLPAAAAEQYEAHKREAQISLRLEGSRLLIDAARVYETFVQMLVLEEVVGVSHDMKGAVGDLENLKELLAASAVTTWRTPVHASSAGR